MKVSILIVSILFLTLTQVVNAQPSTSPPIKIEVFTVADRPLERAASANRCCVLLVSRLDGMDALSESLSAGLSTNPAIAEQQAIRLFADQKHEIEATVRRQTEMLGKIYEYQLERYPALVFNSGESVIYGVTDIRLALSIYEREMSSP